MSDEQAAATTQRIFLAHAKDADAQAFLAMAQRWAAAGEKSPITAMEFTLARDEYERAFATGEFSWADWIRKVSIGKRYADGQPNYHVLLVDRIALGRATYQMIEAALNINKPCGWLREGIAEPIVGVVRTPGNGEGGKDSWTNYGKVVLG